eukprot:scaffold320012_cov40-Prasinocladus_malaysianus.AAC.1
MRAVTKREATKVLQAAINMALRYLVHFMGETMNSKLEMTGATISVPHRVSCGTNASYIM